MNNTGGGAERVLSDVANCFADRGYEVSLLSFDEIGGCSFYSLDSRIKRYDLAIGSTDKPATISTTLKRIVKMRGAIKDISPDVVIGFMHSMYIPLGVALIGTGIPVLASEHIVPKHYESRYVERNLLKLVPLFIDKITCVSEKVKTTFSPSLQKKMVCIPNPVTTQTVERSNVAGEKGKQKTLLSIGRLECQKDHETLVRAFGKIANDVPDWNLRIVGEGSLRVKLEKVILNMNLSSRVEMPGSTHEISLEYLSAQLFVSPSVYESFGLTAAEALAHGLPVIAFSDCPGTNEFVEHGVNGALVESSADRVVALADELKLYMLSLKKRKQLAANSKVPVGYDMDNVIRKWELLINSVRA